MNLPDNLQRKSVNGAGFNNHRVVQETYRSPTDSWFQKRLTQVRNEIKREMLAKLTRSIKEN